jgi:hypothetical protein
VCVCQGPWLHWHGVQYPAPFTSIAHCLSWEKKRIQCVKLKPSLEIPPGICRTRGRTEAGPHPAAASFYPLWGDDEEPVSPPPSLPLGQIWVLWGPLGVAPEGVSGPWGTSRLWSLDHLDVRMITDNHVFLPPDALCACTGGLEISLRYWEKQHNSEFNSKAKLKLLQKGAPQTKSKHTQGESARVSSLMWCCPSPESGRFWAHSLHSWLIGKRTLGGGFEDKEV